MQQSVGIAHTAYYLPPLRKHIDDWAQEQAVSRIWPGLLEEMKKNGLGYYHVATDLSVHELAIRAARQLLLENDVNPSTIGAVVFTHTLQLTIPAPPVSMSAEIKKALGLRKAVCFSISQQNCASFMTALRLAKSMIAVRPRVDAVLIVSADKTISESQRNLGSYAIQSDGACAFLVKRDAPYNRIGSVVMYVDSRYHAGLNKSDELAQRYAQQFGTVAYRTISSAIKASGRQPTYFKYLLTPNANLAAFRSAAKLAGISSESLYTKNIFDKGHSYASDQIINLSDLIEEGSSVGASVIVYTCGNVGCFGAMIVDNLAPPIRRVPRVSAIRQEASA